MKAEVGMHQPELTRAVAEAHIAELRRQAAPAGRRRSPRPRHVGAVRRRSGWLLIEIGLRLAARPALVPVRR